MPVTTAVHVVTAATKSRLAASVTVYVPGGRPVNVALPLPAMVLPVVEIVADMVTPPGPVRVNVKLPLPPVVFLVITTEPRALLRNEGVQGVEPETTTAVHVVTPTGTKSGLAASVTSYDPG